jgi:hypothetical protein
LKGAAKSKELKSVALPGPSSVSTCTAVTFGARIYKKLYEGNKLGIDVLRRYSLLVTDSGNFTVDRGRHVLLLVLLGSHR